MTIMTKTMKQYHKAYNASKNILKLTKLLWFSGIGAPAGVPVSGFEL